MFNDIFVNIRPSLKFYKIIYERSTNNVKVTFLTTNKSRFLNTTCFKAKQMIKSSTLIYLFHSIILSKMRLLNNNIYSCKTPDF